MKTILFAALASLVLTSAQAQITSTFETDADGWMLRNDNDNVTATVIHTSTGGNPGGFISGTLAYDNYPGFFWYAPTKFLGNLMYRSYGQTLSFSQQQAVVGDINEYNGNYYEEFHADIMIASGNNTIYYHLPKPAIAPAWSTYTITLDTSSPWRTSASASSPLATINQIKAALINVTEFAIRGNYNNTANTVSLDQVSIGQRSLATPLTISTISQLSGKPGSSITISGSNFGVGIADNNVYFGGVAATVTNASATSLTVTVPVGASYDQIIIINKTTGVSIKSLRPFNPTFDGGGRIIPASFKPKVDFLLGTTAGNDVNGIRAADLDGDGWNDLIVTEQTPASVSIFQNLGTGGAVSTSAFSSKILLTGGGASGGLFIDDLDGDGKQDIVAVNNSTFATFRNTSTPGNITFETVETWSMANTGFLSNVADIDGDGRPELVGQHGNGSVAVDFWIAQNISSSGNIEFGPSVSYFGGGTLDAGDNVSVGDLDDDGKPELLVSHGFGDRFSILQNNSLPGTIAFTNLGTIVTGQYNLGLSISDFNLDGKNDIVWKRSSNIYIRLNTNSGATLAPTDFDTEIVLTGDLATYGGMSIGDINGDGKPDIVTTDNADAGVFENAYAGGVFDAKAFIPAYQHQGNGNSTYPTSPVVADLNNDNKPELLLGVTNTSPVRISIFENMNIHAPVISVNTVSPLKGIIGSTVTITGNNFSLIPSENKVFFGGVEATVLSSTANLITAEVPAGANNAFVSITKDGLTSRYRLPFQTTFGPGATFDNTHFAPPVNFTLTGANYNLDIGDLNRDGMPDIIAGGTASNTYAFRNSHTTGAIVNTSLVPDDTIASSTYPRLEDLDGDGYLDVMSVNGTLRKNNSTLTELSFLLQVIVPLGASVLDFADFNNDGKTDMTLTTDLSGAGDLLVLENRTLSVPGNFVSGTYGSFSQNILFNKPSASGSVASEDFDGDGFADIVTTNPLTDNVSIYPNTGLPKISSAQFAARVDITVGDNPGRIYKGDFDTDGKIDLLLYHGTGTNNTLLTILHNTSTIGNISFTRIDLTNPSVTTVATIADLDGDGKPEIITTSETGNRFSIFKNIHTSGALSAASFAAPFNTTVTAPRGITTGDLNLDGKPEIILTRAAGLLVVYENLVGNPSITSFNPSSGPVGTTVTITGANFSSTPANNIVTFNGIATMATASTATSITTTVPAGATSGVISVTVNGATGMSATDFTVTFPVLTPGLVWARGHIGTTDTFSEDVTTDAAGNVYTTGQFDQTTDFDPGPGVLNLTSAGNADIYVSKLNANGDLAWAFSLGSITSDAGTGIATDATGNVYVSGSFSGTVDFDPGPGTTNLIGGGRFLCKFDTNGNLISAFGLPGALSVDFSIAVDPADNLYLAGGFSGTADFDPGTGAFNMTSAGSTDIFILKLSPSGTFIWARRMGSTLLDRAIALELDATGSAHITGSFNGTVDFDPGAGTANLTSAGATDAFILKLDNAGNYLWAKRVGGTSALDTGNGIALDGNNNVLITGRFDGTVDFDPGAAVDNLTSFGGGDAFVLKLNSAGNFVWAKNMGGTFGDAGIGIVCDAFDNVYTTGDLRSNTADFDPGPGTFNLSPTGSWEVYVSGLDAAGNFMWAIASQGAASSSVYQPELSLDAAGNIILIGVIEDAPADLDPGICVTNISTNGVTAFIAKLRPGTISSCGPTITINPQPASTTACVGTSATFITGATGTTNILYQWQFSTTLAGTYTDINNGGGYSNAGTASLSVNTTGTFGAGFYRCRIAGDLAAPIFTNAVELTINALPIAPNVTNGSRCGEGVVTLAASGGVNGEYRWYTSSTGGIAIAGEVNSSYVTPSITATTPYFVSLNNGVCESLRTPVTATVNPLPAIPTITSNITPVGNALTICSTASLLLSASNGFSSYIWSNGATTSQINISTSGSYSVVVTDGAGCTSPASEVITVTVVPAPCTNSAPVITNSAISTTVGNSVSLDLSALISDADNNLVLSSLIVLQQPGSGALATISNGMLTINYSGISFSGKDQLTIQVCDEFGECTDQLLEIDVIGGIEIYNALSPNGDDQNEIFLIRYIDLLPDTQQNKVTIYNRWGSKVFEVTDYNNNDRVFKGLNDNGNELPSGTYFYKILFKTTGKTENGFLVLKR